MKHQSFIVSLVAIVALSGLVTTQDNDEDSKTAIVQPKPQPYFMESDSDLRLECHYMDTDAADVTLSWYKDDDQLFDGRDGFYMTNEITGDILVSTLNKKNADLEDTASYNCRKADTDSSKGYDMQLYVFTIVPPLPEDAVAEPKQDLELQCQVEGELFVGYKPMVWTKGDGTPIVSDDTKYKTNDANDTLIIFNIVKEDITNYTCGFTLKNGQNFSVLVRVQSEPHVQHFTKSKNLVQGDPLSLTCETWGVPLPSVAWLKEGDPIEDDDRVSYTDSEEGIINATLRITDLDFDDRAEYTCVAENIHGASNSTILVRVKDKLAALWPFLGICAEVAVLCIIIFIYERRRAKKMEEEEQQEEAGHLTNSNDHKGKDDIRHRK